MSRTIVHLVGDGVYGFEVHGESFYQPALASIVEAKRNPRGAAYVVATLVPEDNNPADNNAVRVDVDGKKVGYVPRIFAPGVRYAAEIRQINGLISCPAVIRGRTMYGISLDLPADFVRDVEAYRPPAVVVIRERERRGCGWTCGNVAISILLILFGMFLVLFFLPGLFLN